ncbi:hypothetical protein [Vibrio nereis]|uniref:Uncharacterized protein n=1 Tax=Vibrio nereis TaxID=693 RepID=A0A0M0HID8_VIBNE|nr:hypothetical protein [Vibrio nereis]KOO01835.1 hypothetical protein AKJ17_18445 [Vibrio nereis]
MLFKEKLLLSNCDSVRQLRLEELRKRFLMGMVFGDGVVLSPNTLVDNHNMDEILKKRNLVKYLNEEGSGKLVIRGFNLKNSFDLEEYYEKLPSNFILSSIEGAPEKGKLTNYQQVCLLERIRKTQAALNAIVYKSEKVALEKSALQDEIFLRINDDLAIGNYFKDDGDRILFKRKTSKIFSRSDWYNFSDDYFGKISPIESRRFKNEVVNPSYNSLFATKGEGFLLDDIKVLKDVPEKILDVGVVYKSLKNEIELVQYPYKAFEIITTLGATDLLQFITDEAMGYIEDKCKESAARTFTRKNWFGMYPKMQQFLGLELK